ncbi:hypothetical protein G4B84_001881 [Aspergillus flavus NRRL3357]|nr:uncharacterized protein G4B84_001881 [Aspergillus flavus NRRL3357]QMW26636.1 hypothetical protein G4B84_001881 [Aspergillus flavus NRRL3357]
MTTQNKNQYHELPIKPHGILWQEDFITPTHEAQLISIFQNQLEWPTRNGRISLHYGYSFDYKTFGIDPDIPYKEFPDWLQPLIPTTEGRPPEQVCLQFRQREGECECGDVEVCDVAQRRMGVEKEKRSLKELAAKEDGGVSG